MCLICQKEFKENTYLKRHILRYHPIKKEDVTGNCTTKIKKEPGQIKDLYHEIQEKKKSLTCSFCYERFENNANLTEHIAATHCKTFTKRTLPKTFPQKSTFLDAEKKSEKPKSKIVHLPLNLNLPLNLENVPSNLNLPLPSNSNLPLNLDNLPLNLDNLPLNLDNLPPNLDNITSGKKDVDYYRCPTCPRSFLIESDLEKHIIEHDQKSYFCPYCGNCYAHKCHLTSHINSKHEPYECQQCFSRFSEKVNLTEHIAAHKRKKEQTSVIAEIIQPSSIKKEKPDQDIKSKIVLPLNLDNLPLKLDNITSDRKDIKRKRDQTNVIAEIIQPSSIKKDIKSKIVHMPLNLDNLPLRLDNITSDRKNVKIKVPEQGLKKQVTCTLDLKTLSVSTKTVITKSVPNLKINSKPKVENIETEVQKFEPEVIIKEELPDFLQEELTDFLKE